MAHSVHLSDDAYKLLTALKREGESYSDVVTRLSAERRDPRALLKLAPPRDDFDLDEFRSATAAKDSDKLRRLGLGGGA